MPSIRTLIGQSIINPFPPPGVPVSTGLSWAGTAGINDLADVSAAAPNTGEVLTFTGAQWESQPVPDYFPLQPGSAGLYLTTNGSSLAWDDPLAVLGLTIGTDFGVAAVGLTTAVQNLGTTAVTSLNVNLALGDTTLVTATAASPLTVSFNVSGLSATSALDKTIIVTNTNGVAINWPGTILWEFGELPPTQVAGTTAIYNFLVVGQSTIYGFTPGQEFA